MFGCSYVNFENYKYRHMKKDKTKNTPFINLSVKECRVKIEGPSYSEDIDDIYKDVIKWIENEVPKLNCELNFELFFTVINSITQKNLMQIFFMLSDFYKQGIKINVIWKVYEDDEDMIELTDEISVLFNFPMKVIKLKY